MKILLMVPVILLISANAAIGQSLLYKRGEYALSVGFDFASVKSKGSIAPGQDATNLHFGGTMAGTVDLSVFTSQTTGTDKTGYGISWEVYAIKEKELGVPFSIGFGYAYADDGDGRSAYSVDAAVYKSARVSSRAVLFPYVGGGFTEYPGGRLPRTGYFLIGLPGSIELEGPAYLTLHGGLAIGTARNIISLGFQISFAL